MESNPFEMCCGAEEIGNFGIEAYSIVKASLQNRINRIFEEIEANNAGEDYMTPGALVATTVPEQRGAIRALKFLKFRKVFAFTNPGTSHKVTLWAKKLN